MDSSAALLPSSHHTFIKVPELDVWGASGEANFELEDLLDFPNDEDILQGEEEEEGEGEGEDNDDGEGEASKLLTTIEEFPAQSSQEAQPPAGLSCHASEKKNFPQEPSSYGLCVPPDELASQLEWLSAFNEDSSYSGDRKLASLVSSGSLCASDKNNGVDGNGNKGPTNNKGGGGGPDIVMPVDKFHSTSPVSVLELEGRAGVLLPVRTLYHAPQPLHVPSRARSKRARSGGRVWSLDTLMPTLLDNRLRTHESSFVGENELSSSSSSTTTTSSSTSSSCFPSSSLHKKRPFEKKAKKERRNPDTSPPRRCSHCLVQKTPQWRAGPMGPKTLCNACGVRYKSGRLLPEYRPAGSPSFVSEVHSNSHKRVLEMRRLKEVMEVMEVGQVEQQQWQQQQRQQQQQQQGQHEEVLNEGSSLADENCSSKNSVEPCDEGPSIACKDLEDAPSHHQLPLCKDITGEPPSEKTTQPCNKTIELGKECQSHKQNPIQEEPIQPCEEGQPTSEESPIPHHADQGQQAHGESHLICKLNAEMPCVPNPINVQQEHHLQGDPFMQE